MPPTHSRHHSIQHARQHSRHHSRHISSVRADLEVDASPNTKCNIFFNSLRRLIQRGAHGIIPSFLQRKTISAKQQRLHPTSYLDGLRGVASFIVFMGHYTEENIGWFAEPYGLYEDGAPSSPLQLPLVRVLYSARPMVHIFFIISGFVLAYKPIMQIHAQQYSALASTISSSVFRRALRLFLPSLIALFIMAIAVHTGLSDVRYANRLPEASAQLKDWWGACSRLLQAAWSVANVSAQTPRYNPALWTIPIEFAQSMILFITLIGLSRCRNNIRMLLLAGIMIFCFNGGQLYTVEFLGGVLIAEINILNQGRSFSSPFSSPAILPKYSLEDRFEEAHGQTIRQRAMQVFWALNIISGLFIGSWTNDHADEVWGIKYLSNHTPSPYQGQGVWFCLGAFQIVIACTQLESLQNLFNHGIAQYLGGISYALYLTHNLCLTSLEPRVSPFLDSTFGKQTRMGRHLHWAVGLAIYLPIIICVSDIFWRAIDVPTVKLARWVESKCVVDVEPKKV
ncbi:hypothetical protein HYALB_00006524 [Hymenoscyphus albidus]|uniref:Acyltransferase 3 domain-containing protein n=1 Tax=Hymenoscyphus albidus TaxID=595503 RepID=A0A9N9LQV3_9HELO|nr:hypothetical protein HYALB_00006524 [Hymenoscyphus albidus]